MNSLTRQPIARALVDGNISSVLTDGEGRFELNLPDGMAELTVRRPTYREQGMQHVVNVGANMPDLTFYLTPQATITGHVALSTGEDAENIRFTVYRKVNVNGHDKWMMAAMVGTDSEGIFRVANMETSGVYLLCSVPSQDSYGPHALRARFSAPSIFGFPSVCYPGPIPVSSPVTATNSITVSPGQQVTVELTLIRQPFYHVSISIPNAGRGQELGVRIHDRSGSFTDLSAAWNAQKGLAVIDLPNGQYYAEANGSGPSTSYGRVGFQVANGPVLGLNLELLPLHPIPVEIRKDYTAPSRIGSEDGSANEVRNSMADPGMNLTLTSSDSEIMNTSGSGLTPPKGSTDNALFEIENVTPGQYWVQTFPYEGYVSSITAGGIDLSREPLTVGEGSTVAPIQVVLRNDGGQISCTVNLPANSGPASESGLGEVATDYVYAIPLARTPSLAQSARFAPRANTTTLPNLEPGSYLVAAFDKYQEFDLSDPQDMARFTRHGQTVTVTAGATTSIQLDLVQTGDAESAGQEGSNQ